MKIDFNDIQELTMPGMNNGTGQLTVKMQDLITERETKENTLFKFIGKHRFISALILCLLFFLVYLPLNRFHIYTGGDDPVICKLISNGEVSIGFMGYFFAWFVSIIQAKAE